MTATLLDVARRAGVSEATVSRVINRRRHVAAQTRTRVERAALELDYVPNHAARDLSTARTATVALLVHHAQYPAHGEGTFTSRIVDGVSRALRRAGYDLLYAPVDDAEVRHLARHRATRSGRSDGIIVLGPAFPRAALHALRATGRPMVVIDNRLRGTDGVLADNRAPMAALARHLVERHGARRITCFAGPARWPSTAERVAGVRDAIAGTAELEVLHARETTMRDGANLAGVVASGPPDAIMAVNDALAIGAIHRLRDRRLPAVTGFDDVAWAALVTPPLTTVAVDASAMADAAAALLLERMTDSNPPTEAREVRVPGELRIRRSCGCGEEGGAG